ncbi:MAG: sporulation protein YunB [Oscillospiraceae bacterium]|nr:sporulation protein YunB [Oscillospiraceae bacterium]MBQ5749572.1 sporulation protein YunB [Oscillospiraceae bacterium]
MRRRNRYLRGALILLACAAIVIAAGILYLRYTPFVREAARITVINAASGKITDAVTEQIMQGSVDYDRLVLLEKDTQGNITAVRTNMQQMNRFKLESMNRLGDMLLDMDMEQLAIPLGSIVMPEFFAGSGPTLPIRILSMNTSESEFISDFSQAGINQAIHQIIMRVCIDLTVLTPAGLEHVEVSSDVPIAETVIVGTVPESYFTVG